MKRTGPTNPYMQELISELRNADVPLWKRIAYDLEKPARQRRIVNIYKLEKYARDGEIVIVPGKVLGDGELKRKVTVAAFTFSQQATDKIHKAGGKTMQINELYKINPKGNNVRILG